MVQLQIRHNVSKSTPRCAVCESLIRPVAGPALFLRDKLHLVCDPCGVRYDARLMEELERRRCEHAHRHNPLTAG